MGRIAERRAQSPEIRDLGSYLVQRHRQAERRLRSVAAEIGVALSNGLSARHLQVQSRFRSIAASTFDKAFIQHEVGDYRYFLRHFEAAAQTGGPTVRAYARTEIANLTQDQAKIAALAVSVSR